MAKDKLSDWYVWRMKNRSETAHEQRDHDGKSRDRAEPNEIAAATWAVAAELAKFNERLESGGPIRVAQVLWVPEEDPAAPLRATAHYHDEGEPCNENCRSTSAGEDDGIKVKP
ncbi:MAG: hypothetical protein KAJ19_21700 [Gammaproteobacteria bacterium]|nr:hypothetical protein [Gammaproteobacteria bacterium]